MLKTKMKPRKCLRTSPLKILTFNNLPHILTYSSTQICFPTTRHFGAAENASKFHVQHLISGTGSNEMNMLNFHTKQKEFTKSVSFDYLANKYQ